MRQLSRIQSVAVALARSHHRCSHTFCGGPWTGTNRPRSHPVSGGSRCYSIARTSSQGEDVERFILPVGSSGDLTIDIYNLSRLDQPTKPLLIYLPPFPAHIQPAPGPPIPSFLSSTSLPIARINYRWNNLQSPTAKSPSSQPPSPSSLLRSPNHAFPIPIHDTLIAFASLTRAFCVPKVRPAHPPDSPQWDFDNSLSPPPPRRPILIYGSHLGASLATSLALTECFASRHVPWEVIGLIARNGIYDWTDIATSSPPVFPSSQEKTIYSSQDPSVYIWPSFPSNIHRLKQCLFSTPSSCFDPFSSSILFFRTAGLATATEWPSCNPETSKPLIKPRKSSANPPESELNNLDIEEVSDTTDKPRPHPTATRRSHLKFPPRNSDLKIPRTLFLYPKDHPNSQPSHSAKHTSACKSSNQDPTFLQTQAEEMARLMKRSVVTHELKDRKMWDDAYDCHAASEERVMVEGVNVHVDAHVDSGERFESRKDGKREGKWDAAGEDDGDEAVKAWMEDVLGE